jgi:hypothetical protein
VVQWLCANGERLDDHAGVLVVLVQRWAAAEHVAAAGLACPLILLTMGATCHCSRLRSHTLLTPCMLHSIAAASRHGTHRDHVASSTWHQCRCHQAAAHLTSLTSLVNTFSFS